MPTTPTQEIEDIVSELFSHELSPGKLAEALARRVADDDMETEHLLDALDMGSGDDLIACALGLIEGGRLVCEVVAATIRLHPALVNFFEFEDVVGILRDLKITESMMAVSAMVRSDRLTLGDILGVTRAFAPQYNRKAIADMVTTASGTFLRKFAEKEDHED